MNTSQPETPAHFQGDGENKWAKILIRYLENFIQEPGFWEKPGYINKKSMEINKIF